MDLPEFQNWLESALQEAEMSLGKWQERRHSRPISVSSLPALWTVFEQSLAQPVENDYAAFGIFECSGTSRKKTCSVEMGRRSGEQTAVEAVVLVLTAPWPRTREAIACGFDSANHYGQPGEPWLFPLEPLVAEFEATPAFITIMAHRDPWDCRLQLKDRGE